MLVLARFVLGSLALVLGIAALPSSASAAAMFSGFVPAGNLVATIPIPEGLTVADAREVVIVSILARKYTLKEKSDTHAVGHLINNGHEATMSFVIKPGAIDYYCEGFKVDRKGERREPETPAGWIKNLQNDITRRMATKLATK